MFSRKGQRPSVARNVLFILVLLVTLLAPTATPSPAHAAVYNIADGDIAGLLAAIRGPAPGSVVNLAPGGTYTLLAEPNDPQAGSGSISLINSADLTINGNGATLQRSSAPGTPL